MSFTRDMMPAWELRAALDASEAEIARLRAAVESKNAALHEAIVFLGHAYTGKAPHVSTNDDGVLTVFWRQGAGGVALIFAGCGEAYYALSSVEHEYTDRTSPIKIGDNMPGNLRAALTAQEKTDGK